MYRYYLKVVPKGYFYLFEKRVNEKRPIGTECQSRKTFDSYVI